MPSDVIEGNIEQHLADDLASLKFNVKTRHSRETSSCTKCTWSHCKYLKPFQRPSHQLQRCVSQSARLLLLLLSVRWRLTEANTSCKHKSDTSQVGMEAGRREGGWRVDGKTGGGAGRVSDRTIPGHIRTVCQKCLSVERWVLLTSCFFCPQFMSSWIHVTYLFNLSESWCNGLCLIRPAAKVLTHFWDVLMLLMSHGVYRLTNLAFFLMGQFDICKWL